MTQELLDRTDIVARFEQVGRERVPQRVARRRPCNATGSRGVLDGALDDRFVQVMPAAFTGRRIPVEPGRRKDPLPGPFTRCTRIFRAQRAREGHGAPTGGQIRIVLRFDACQVFQQRLFQRRRQHRDAIFPALAITDSQLAWQCGTRGVDSVHHCACVQRTVTLVDVHGKTYEAKRGGIVSANRSIGRLKAFFNWAIEREYLSANISTSSRYLKPSKLALHTTIQRIDAQRRASGEAAKWEQELAEIKKTLAGNATKVPQTGKIGSETEFRKARNRQ
jgi:hypothetical protein